MFFGIFCNIKLKGVSMATMTKFTKNGIPFRVPYIKTEKENYNALRMYELKRLKIQTF